MHKISDKDKKIWNFYVSNLNSIKKAEKKKQNLILKIFQEFLKF